VNVTTFHAIVLLHSVPHRISSVGGLSEIEKTQRSCQDGSHSDADCCVKVLSLVSTV
jgi:hypothetical protein